MSKIDLQNAASGTVDSLVSRINSNNAVIETISDSFLSRDGTAPNQMQVSLDMNSNRMLNLPAPVDGTEPFRKADLQDLTVLGGLDNLQDAVASGIASASAAATSEANALTYKNAAATSATTATTQATNAATSATTAATTIAGSVRFDQSQTLTTGQKTQAKTNVGLVIGTDVQAFDSTILKSANIGVTVQAFDAQLFSNLPQNLQGAYTVVATDASKHVFHPASDTTARTWTIPANASVAFPIGTKLTFVNEGSAGVVTIAITTDTMALSPGGTTGSRTLAANGIATAIKITATKWMISGTGLT